MGGVVLVPLLLQEQARMRMLRLAVKSGSYLLDSLRPLAEADPSYLYWTVVAISHSRSHLAGYLLTLKTGGKICNVLGPDLVVTMVRNPCGLSFWHSLTSCVDGWVYTNDAWVGPRPAPYSSGGGSVTRRRRWIRRVWYDAKRASMDS